MAKERKRFPDVPLTGRAARSSGDGGEHQADSDRCPNCGGEFRDVPERPVSKESTRAAAIQASRDKLTDERGQLQACTSCTYTRRAHDEIAPAKA